MLSLIKDLQQKKSSLKEFIDVCIRVLNHLPNVISGVEEKGIYKIYFSDSAGAKKFVRPINKNLFIENPIIFSENIPRFETIVSKIKIKDLNFENEELKLL